MKRILTSLLLAAFATALTPVQADTYYLRGTGDAQGKSSIQSGEGGAGWALTPDGSTVVWPTAGNDYIVWVDPAVKKDVGLRTPAKGYDYTFAGDTLTLESYIEGTTPYWATLITKHKSNKTVTIADLMLKNGRIAISDEYKNIGIPKYAGAITVPSGYKGYFGTSGTETQDRRVEILSSISGAGDIVMECAGTGTRVLLSGNNGGLSGRLYIDHDGLVNTGNQGGARISVNSAASWPSDRPQADAEGVRINAGSALCFNFSGSLATGLNRGFTIANKAAELNVASGGDVTIQGPIASSYGFVKTGAGSLTLPRDNSGLTSGATVSATEGALVLAHPNAIGSAALSISGTASLTLDVTAGAIVLSSAPSVAALTVKASSIADPTSIPLMRLPAGTVFDASQVAFSYNLPASVDLTDMRVLSETDAQGVLVYLGVPAANLPTIAASFQSVSATSATFSLTLGYAGACSDPIVVTAYYGTADCGTDKTAWDGSHAFSAVSPGTADFTVPGLAPETAYYIAFMATPEGGGEEVWTAAMQLSTASIVASAPASIFESDARGVAVTFTRASSVAADALAISLGYSGDTSAFAPASLASTATFEAGSTTASVTLRPVDNGAADGARSITVAVQPGSGYVVGAASSVTISLLDDESYVSADCVWTGANGLNWSDAGNWQGGRVPTMLDTAVLGEGVVQNAEIIVDDGAEAGTLLVPATVSFTLKAATGGGSLFAGGLTRPDGAAGTLYVRVPLTLFGEDGTNRWNLAEGTTLAIYDMIAKAQDPLVVEKTGAGRVETRKDYQTYTGPWVIRAGTVRAYGTSSFAGKAYVGGDETLEAHLEQNAKPAFGNSINPVIYTNGTVYATGGVDGGRLETTTVYAGGKADYHGNIYCKEQIYYGGGVVGGATFYLGYGQKSTVHASDAMAVCDCSLRIAGGASWNYTFAIEDGPQPIDFLLTRAASEGQSDNNLIKNGAGAMKTTQNWGSMKSHVKINAGAMYVDNPGEYGLGMQETTVAVGAKLGGTGCVGMKDAKNANTVALANGSESSYATLSPGSIDETTGAHIYGTFTSGRESAHNNCSLGNWSHLEIGVGPKDSETKLSPSDKLLVYGNLVIGSNCTLDVATKTAPHKKLAAGTYTIVEADSITGTFATILRPSEGWTVAYETEPVDGADVVKRIVLTVPPAETVVLLR